MEWAFLSDHGIDEYVPNLLNYQESVSHGSNCELHSWHSIPFGNRYLFVFDLEGITFYGTGEAQSVRDVSKGCA